MLDDPARGVGGAFALESRHRPLMEPASVPRDSASEATRAIEAKECRRTRVARADGGIHGGAAFAGIRTFPRVSAGV